MTTKCNLPAWIDAGREKRGDGVEKAVKFAWGLDDSVVLADFPI